MRLACNAAASTQSGEAAGISPIGDVFKKFYGIGTDQTIRYGLIKRPVMSNVPKKNGKDLTWQQYRKETEPRRKQLRQEFADKLEVISYEERDRRRNVGIVIGVLTSVAAAYLISQGAPWVSRLYLYPGIAFAIAFVDSARQGLCTESLAGAWDVDDTGLEYMPTQDLAERVQKKVFKLYARDFAMAVAVMALVCKL